jgi:hypothetical protein
MIAVRLMGGLGNQLFQYALGRSLAARLDTSLAFDRGWFDEARPASHPNRRYELDGLPLTDRLLRFSEQQIAVLEAPRRLIPIGWKVRPRLQVIREGSPTFDADILDSPDASLLVGYWQSEKYFADVADELRDSFASRPRRPPLEMHAERVRATRTIGIHVRRGDYVAVAETADIHGVLTTEYYDAAVAYIAEYANVEQVVVVSDDPAWARAHLSFPLPTWHASLDLQNTRDEFDLLSACDHQVIANSSFSWWAAWLNSNPSKIVVAPRTWYRDPSIDTSDLVPASWPRL